MEIRSVIVACGTAALIAGSLASHLTAQPTPRAPSLQDPQPSDGRWLVDDQGREYFVVEVPRDRPHHWVTEERTRVRLAHGVEMDVVSYDERHLRVKVYRPRDEVAPAPSAEATATERARAAASYRGEALPGQGLELQAFSTGLPQRGQWRNDFDVADFNGDGHLDIVFGPPRKGSRRLPTVFLGDGAGNWKPWAGMSFPALPFDYGDVKAVDLNGDGIRDVVLATHLRGIVALVGDGRGRFTAWSQGIEFTHRQAGDSPVFSSRAISIVDWNRDGRPDVVALGEGPSPAARPGLGPTAGFQAGSRGTIIYLNEGNGTWTKIVNRESRNFGGSIAVADFDRDGRTDFVTGSDRWRFTALLNMSQADGTWRETPLPFPRPDAIYRAVASADFDGDGRPDLAVGFTTREHGVYRTGIDVLLNPTGGWQRRTLGALESTVAIQRIATGDLDGDGHPDLVGIDENGDLWVFRGDGKGGFSREPTPELRRGERCRGYGLHLVDLDRDGTDEIVLSLAAEASGLGPLGKSGSCPSEGALQAWKVVRKHVVGG